MIRITLFSVLQLFAIQHFADNRCIQGKYFSNEHAGPANPETAQWVLNFSWYHYDDQENPYYLEFSIAPAYNYNYIMEFYNKRTHSSETFKNYIWKDPFKNNLQVVADGLQDLAESNGLSKTDVALSFVQSLPFTTVPYYQKYAMQTLYDYTGDCSDKSILFAGILTRWDIDCVFLVFYDHLAVGIYSLNRYGSCYPHRGRNFYFCESTAPGLMIGDAGQKTGYRADIQEVY